MKSNALITWTITAIVVWTGISTYWYVCGIKNFCFSSPITIVDGKPSGEEIVTREEEYVRVDNTDNRRRVVTETVTEKITIQCSSYLNTFMRYGYNNYADDVRRLQEFLNRYENENLAEDGIFGKDEEDAVKRFQVKYKAEVMDPWGMTVPSGYVYATTRNHINALQCAFEFANKNNNY